MTGELDFSPPLFAAHFSNLDLKSVFLSPINGEDVKKMCFSVFAERRATFQNSGDVGDIMGHLSACVSVLRYACGV